MASSSTGSSNSDLVRQFVRMGFLEKLVVKAIKDNGEDNAEAILETLLTYSATENFLEEPLCSPTNPDSFESGGDFPDDLSDGDSYLGNEENTSPLSRKDELLCQFVEMGYSADETLAAIDNCGLNTPTAELMDFICAAQMAKEADAYFPPEDEATIVQNPTHEMPRTDYFPREKRRKLQRDGRHDIIRGNRVNGDDDIFRPPNPMIGFGIPNEPWQIVDRALPVAATGPPYFYYENVALAPKGVWSAISRFLYDIQPEFVDSLFFCAAARKRGYVHNLPIQNRHPLMPIPPSTIQEALPSTKKWWPSWDPRTKFNCLQTCIGSAKLSERIRKKLEDSDSEPPVSVRQYVLEECRRWNLVWVGRNKVAPLEPDEMEMLLGFPRDHTRGGGISRTDRYKSLGNTFQVDTVGYHLSVLKELFPNGINLLSLFSGIGGAEVALHRLGIPLKNVVSVEISETNRNILRSWWEQTNQRGNLIHIADVQKVSAENLSQWISSFGGFDLVIGGSPCNNLSGSNRHTRDGLEGEHSSLFFEYCRILDLVKSLMGN